MSIYQLNMELDDDEMKTLCKHMDYDCKWAIRVSDNMSMPVNDPLNVGFRNQKCYQIVGISNCAP